jgi:hypothetical protein
MQITILGEYTNQDRIAIGEALELAKDIYMEFDEQKALIQQLSYSENRYPALKWLHAIPNASGVGGTQGILLGKRFKAEGRKKGVFDLFFPYPNGNFHGLYIEMKYGKGSLSDEQKEFEAFIDNQGYASGVAWSSEEAIAILERYTGWDLGR